MSLYAVTLRLKPVQIIEASNRSEAIEIVRRKFLNAFITKVEKTQKQKLWCDRIVIVTPNNTRYLPFEVTYHEYCDGNALIEAQIKYGKIATCSIKKPVEALANAI
jgi:hypothetical protein